MYKVLVIEDDRVIGEMIKLILEHKGYKVYLSYAPEEVVNKADNEKFDIILLDQFLLGLNGIDICKELKQHETTNSIPILMMSALPEVKKNCLEAGATGFLSKPFDRKFLLSKIEKILNKSA